MKRIVYYEVISPASDYYADQPFSIGLFDAETNTRAELMKSYPKHVVKEQSLVLFSNTKELDAWNLLSEREKVLMTLTDSEKQRLREMNAV